ncbi:MAG: polymer-forming cytoskeletal family protein [Epsilonproteobacteria bacterium]|nr:polymer-forming cytoskeletal family protein [Campylobacterota bacterium]
MAIFNKGDTMAKTTNSTTLISKGAMIKGELEFSAKLHVEGRVEGTIVSTNEISIGKEGSIKGTLKANKLTVNGSFEGTAECDTIEIVDGGEVRGEIIIKNIIIEKGGCFVGTSKLKTTAEKKD